MKSEGSALVPGEVRLFDKLRSDECESFGGASAYCEYGVTCPPVSVECGMWNVECEMLKAR